MVSRIRTIARKAAKAGRRRSSCMSTPSTYTRDLTDARSRRRPRKPLMGTTDVRVDVKLNKHIWSCGLRSIPRRVRVRIARKRNDEEDMNQEFYSRHCHQGYRRI